MSLVWLILLFAAYTAIQAVTVQKLFPSADFTPLCIAFVISNAMAFFGVVLNGMIPPVPLSAGDGWIFILVMWGGMAAANGFAINQALDKQRLGLMMSVVFAAGLNFILLIFFGWPVFQATLGASNLLFK